MRDHRQRPRDQEAPRVPRLAWSASFQGTSLVLAATAAGLAAFTDTILSDIRQFLVALGHLRIPLGAVPVILVLIIALLYVVRNGQARARRSVEVQPFQPFHEVPLPPEERERGLGPATTLPGGIHIWRKDQIATVAEAFVPAAPSLLPPPPTPFLRNLLVTFALLAATILLFRHAFFYVFDRVVLALSLVIYWPLGAPTILSHVTLARTVPDYIFAVYFSFLAAYLLASGVLTTERFDRRQVRSAIGLALTYPVVAMLADVLFFTTGEPFSHSAALLLRGILGGLFVGGMILVTVQLPSPVRVKAVRPAEPGIVTLFFLSVATAAVVALGVLYVVFRYVGIGRSFVPIGILLLLPLTGLTIWALIGQAVYRNHRHHRPLPPVSSYHPPVTIIIPAFNEEEHLATTVRAADAAARLYPGSTEILVGNDGSSDRTLPIAIRAILDLQHATGAVLDLPHGGKANALNALLRAAKGEIIVRIDADTRISSTVGFSEVVPHFADPDIGGVQGMLLPLQQTGWTSRLRFLEIVWNHLFLRPATMGLRACQVVDGAFSAFRRSDLLAIGGWVNWNGEDTEVTLRLQRQGFRLRLETAAAAFEDVPGDYRALERQRIRWNRGGVYAHYRHFYPSLTEAWAFGGLAMVYWVALFVRSGLRSGLYLYVVLAAIFVPTILHLAIILVLLLVPRGIVIAVYMIRLRRGRWIPWIAAWPAFSLIKQQFAVKSWGTMFPGEAHEFA